MKGASEKNDEDNNISNVKNTKILKNKIKNNINNKKLQINIKNSEKVSEIQKLEVMENLTKFDLDGLNQKSYFKN